MDFNEEVKQLAKRISQIKGSITTEEATKMSLIVPMFQLLGYDVFNPQEFCPEYTTDVGIKKGEKVDYAILKDNDPIILIECKSCNEDLDKHGSQLFRYFATSKAAFAILTNGIIYKFFTDIETANIMDSKPFLEINMLNLKETSINELKKFHKSHFNTEKIFSNAAELKYTKEIKDIFQQEIDNPSPGFIKFLIDGVYSGVKTQKVIDLYTPLVKKALNTIINDIVNQKLSTALDTTTAEAKKEAETSVIPESKIVTTEEEIEAFYMVRGMLAENIPIEKITYRDVESYFGILFDDNNRKPICRLILDDKKKQLFLPDADKNFEKIDLKKLTDIYKYKKKLLEIAERY